MFLPAFSAPAALALIAEHRVSAFIAVPAMVVDLLAADRAAGPRGSGQGSGLGSWLGFSSVCRVLLGGGELPAGLIWRLRLLFPSAVLTTAYGMTEACSSITFRRLGRADPAVYGADHSWRAAGGRGSEALSTGVGSARVVLSRNRSSGVADLGLSIKAAERISSGAPEALGDEVAARGSSGGSEGVVMSGTDTSGAAPDGVCVGHPPAGIEVAVRPLGAAGGVGRVSDFNRASQLLELGEVLTRGPHVMLRYWGDPAATAGAFVAHPALVCSDTASCMPAASPTSSAAGRDVGSESSSKPSAGSPARGSGDSTEASAASQNAGLAAGAGPPGRVTLWLRTGDLGYVDARGRLWLAGRLKDVVRSGGESVNAAEVS